MTEWQPIETAPKDGHRLILAGNNRSYPWVAVGSYRSASKNWVADCAAHHPHLPLANVTHWKPLDEPPEAT